jgi:hypothetical protein
VCDRQRFKFFLFVIDAGANIAARLINMAIGFIRLNFVRSQVLFDFFPEGSCTDTFLFHASTGISAGQKTHPRRLKWDCYSTRPITEIPKA